MSAPTSIAIDRIKLSMTTRSTSERNAIVRKVAKDLKNQLNPDTRVAIREVSELHFSLAEDSEAARYEGGLDMEEKIRAAMVSDLLEELEEMNS